jgi:chaperone BCS1
MDFIYTYFEDYIIAFNAYAKDYPMVAGALSLWGLGVLSYLGKDIPERLFNTFKRLFTTTVTLTSSNDSFYLFLKWYQDGGHAKKVRYLKITNGRWGSDELIKSLGYGNHWFWYNKFPIFLVMAQMDSSATDREKDQITMTVLGRSHKLFDLLFNEMIVSNSKNNKMVIKKYSTDYWRISSEQRPRTFDSIYLKSGVKEQVTNYLDNFQTREHWYLDKGIPYQTGILLYGPPGTGKTSIIKAISHYLGYQIHSLSSSALCRIEDAMFTLPEKSLIVIEDIDGCTATLQRQSLNHQNNDKKLISEQPPLEHEVVADSPASFSFSDLDISNLSDILNAIDGIHHIHGRILIATTNYIEKLDEALVREGRFDLKIEVGYVDDFILCNIFNDFYDDYLIPSDFKIRDKVSVAYIQNLILKNLDSPDIILEDLKY